MMREDIRLQILSDPRLLGSIRGIVRSYVDIFGFSPDRVAEIVLAVNEACANSIRHAYKGRRDRRLEVILRSDERWVEIVVRDKGKPAPRDRVVRKELVSPQDHTSLKPGGLGVQLIYRVFDKVGFTPGPTRGNRVAMRLKRPDVRRETA